MNFFFLLILTMLGAAVGVYAIFARDLSGARARLAGRSQTIDTPLGILEYAIIGDGEPALIIHGAGGGFDQAIDMAGALAGRGYRLIAPSRFGYLGSPLPTSLVTAMQADAYAELFDRLGVSRAFVIAISAGAWSALQFAIRHPQRCRVLVLLVPAQYLPPRTRNHGGPLLRVILASDFAAWAALKLMWLVPGAMARTMLGTDPLLVRAAEPNERARVRELLDHLLPVSSRTGGMQFDIRTAATPKPYPIEGISCPVLTVSAEDDRFDTAARARQIAASAPNGRAVIYPTGGHALVGCYHEALSEITSFLSENSCPTA
jgi:2-hydroxy-6-oxonona-2,4-dienedioate hydrolase